MKNLEISKGKILINSTRMTRDVRINPTTKGLHVLSQNEMALVALETNCTCKFDQVIFKFEISHTFCQIQTIIDGNLFIL